MSHSAAWRGQRHGGRSASGGVPPETVLSFAPTPGAVRVFHFNELRQIAARFHLTEVPEGDICVERAMAPLDPAAYSRPCVKSSRKPRSKFRKSASSSRPKARWNSARAGLHNNIRRGNHVDRRHSLCAQSRLHHLGQSYGNHTRAASHRVHRSRAGKAHRSCPGQTRNAR